MEKIDKSKFKFSKSEDRIIDNKFQTKRRGYYTDALIRFGRNRMAVVGFVVIFVLVMFSIFVPIFTKFDLKQDEFTYKYMPPKSNALSKIGLMTGVTTRTGGDGLRAKYYAINIAAGYFDYFEEWESEMQNSAVKYPKWILTEDYGVDNLFNPLVSVTVTDTSNPNNISYSFKVDRYKEVGFIPLTIDPTEYHNIREFEMEMQKTDPEFRILFPMVDRRTNLYFRTALGVGDPSAAEKAFEDWTYYWFACNNKGEALTYKDLNNPNINDLVERKPGDPFIENFRRDANGNVMLYEPSGATQVRVKVYYPNYYLFANGKPAPVYFFGSDSAGLDVMLWIAKGIQRSLLLGIIIAVACFIIGAVIGAAEGYYGGAIDIVVERIIDIIAGLPFIVVATLFNYHLVATGKASLFVGIMFTYMLTGWISTSATVRMQFYRFKNQEYVLAARTLGANDFRIMFKHIFPNTLGTIVTRAALAIPMVISGEAVLTYLSIFNATDTPSIGLMLSNNERVMSTYPHLIMLPALVLGLLMISFNLLGNGLRDAFNPTLRGGKNG